MAMQRFPVALVTGGGGLIGQTICLNLLRRGWAVGIADADGSRVSCSAQRLAETGPVFAVPADVTDESSVRDCVTSTLAYFGRIDVLINNAGISGPVNQPVAVLDLAAWDKVLRTNLTGCFLMAKHTVPHLKKQKGCIVNIASTRAMQSESNTEAYAASKGGLVALTHALAVSLGPDIRVNCISPGWIAGARLASELSCDDHQQHPVGRVGRPEDVAAMVEYLVSKEAGFVTGQNFVVDGGMTRKMIYL